MVYALDSARSDQRATTPIAAPERAPTLIINPTHSAPGFDTQHIVYVRVTHQLEHFARSDWIDTPARMLAPLIVSAINSAGSFRAVVPATSGIAGDLRLDTEVVRLQQEFGVLPSRVRFTLRATLVDNATRQIISWREFDETIDSQSEDPYGGVIAANRAVKLVLEQLARYCTLASATFRTTSRIDSTPTGHRLSP
ncbi:ABC-type transport auxiliary lipoprotein family protein [Acidovorax sp. A1169]|uniref:ABC-type transport auxiliary lipoprotein family protein n=1 Tax=Acidovorax sp. A1169 TaxID=3059524 RepID=UPI0027378552|nr:ABC-type transport auxiliary lipoprotein family protein [Acidovorax sp. A1169]MDP4076381.1 ABC-type transport auxiliary lipoprotein family protein [Acidovorax sp. A1169]